MNLATNARDAMPHGGTILIETGLVAIEKDFIRLHGYGEPGTYALLSVTDTGTGMDETTKKKIFEPFFTTKEVGKGTGLGLSLAYGIIKQHNGYINVYSEPGIGTRFRIYLPAVSAPAKEDREPSAITPSTGGTETILLAEDDAAVRMLTETVLTEFGYNVITAENGEDAVRKFMEHNDVIHLCLIDAIMPKKNGREVYNEIRKIRPDVKTLFVSGYSADIVTKQGIEEEGLDFILKPVSPRDLLKKIREILDRQIR